MLKIDKRVGVLFVLVLLVPVVFQMSSRVAHASRGGDQRQLVPLYVYPDLSSSPSVWKSTCDSLNGDGDGATVIANVGKGYGSVPGGPEGFGYPTMADGNYTAAIDYCHDDGINVIGYVTTSYGARPTSDVEQDISDWYRLWPTLDGIFVDEANNSSDSANAAYYHTIWSYVQDAAPNSYQNDVIINPGNTDSNSAWMLGYPSSSTQAADELVAFEGSAACFRQWEANSLSGDCAALYGNAGEPSWERHWGCSNDIIFLVYGPDGSTVEPDSTTQGPWATGGHGDSGRGNCR
jgi:hypothetical protein